MPLEVIRNDITKIKCDAIVNPTDEKFSGGGGLDYRIHKAAGFGLRAECAFLGPCRPGKAKITKGYKLPCRYVIHTVGPVWKGGSCGEEEILLSCYRECLALAEKQGCKSVAFPLISAGTFGYPKEKAIKTAFGAFSEFLLKSDMLIYLVVYDNESAEIGGKLFPGLEEFIDDNYCREEKRDSASFSNRRIYADSFPPEYLSPGRKAEYEAAEVYSEDAAGDYYPVFSSSMALGCSLPEGFPFELDESFSEMLMRKIDEKGMTDAECYKKANIDRKLFSKIRGNRDYHPKKSTALAFAAALELPFEEAEELLRKAGFSFSKSSKFDVIVEYFFKNGVYDIFTINEALYAYDQNLLGQ